MFVELKPFGRLEVARKAALSGADSQSAAPVIAGLTVDGHRLSLAVRHRALPRVELSCDPGRSHLAGKLARAAHHRMDRRSTSVVLAERDRRADALAQLAIREGRARFAGKAHRSLDASERFDGRTTATVLAASAAVQSGAHR
jgi:hypothetical protein